MKAGITKSAWKSQLGRRLMLWVIVISALNALIATSIQLTLDYRRDLTDVTNALTYTEEHLVSGIAEAIYNYDANQLDVQIQGINGSPWIAGVMAKYGPMEREITYGEIDLDSQQLRAWPLIVEAGTNRVEVGRLYVAPNMDTVYQRTVRRISIVLLTQTIKTFVVSLSILLLFAALITRHLEKIASYTSSFSSVRRFYRLTLNRAPRNPPDELDELVDSLNNTGEKLVKAREREKQLLHSLEQKVAERTEELEKANRKLEYLSETDFLTNLANRRKFFTDIESELRRAKRTEQSMALALIDVDHFKSYNDNYGHPEGDRCLKRLAEILSGFAQRPGDLAARYGGEEFALLLGNMEYDDAVRHVNELRTSIESKKITHQHTDTGVITVSIGLAVLRPGAAFTSSKLIDMADKALYRAKDNGRNRVEVVTSTNEFE
ncbi:diguanylate cyclase [Vibrio sp. HN007]|uniref:sensor domain-containing diguanylate cyclase n=1 Tax=Vibrio iocasae TaxID=3098914 RepID=UPI0035D43D34